MIGQIQVTQRRRCRCAARCALRDAAAELLDDARRLVPRLAERGGGPVALRRPRARAAARPRRRRARRRTSTSTAATRWARTSSTRCARRSPIASRAIAGGRPGLRILSNLTDGRTDHRALPRSRTRASRRGRARAVAAASRFAELDPYRAATHNKGIMNGVDAVLVATGQDWRAVEAGAHAYAARTGTLPAARDVARRRRPRLVGELVMPLAVGTVGGALHVAPGRAARARARRRRPRRPARRASPAPPASRRTSPRCAPSPPKASSAATWRCTRAASRAPPVPPATSSIASPRSCPRAATSNPTAPARSSRGLKESP